MNESAHLKDEKLSKKLLMIIVSLKNTESSKEYTENYGAGGRLKMEEQWIRCAGWLKN